MASKFEIIDKNGEADLSWHEVPLNAIKKATFKDKMNVLHDLFSLTVRGITYNFKKTAQYGAVVFRGNGETWEFVAPDGRLTFADYDTLTLGQTLAVVRQTLVEKPIPAWDTFIAWVNNFLSGLAFDESAVPYCYLFPINSTDTARAIKVNTPTFKGWTDFVSLIDSLTRAFAPAKNTAQSTYRTSDTSFGYKLTLVGLEEDGTESSIMSFNFVFRE